MNFLEYFGTNLLLCLVGLAGYFLWSIRNHMHDFKKAYFWNHNRTFIVWVTVAQILYAGLMAYVPALELWLSKRVIAVLEAAVNTSLEIPEDLVNIVVYLTLAWQLSRFTNVKTKTKINV